MKGTSIGLADCLSRLPLEEIDPDTDETMDEDLMVCTTTTSQQHEIIAEATRVDPEMQAVKGVILRGWPLTKQETPSLAAPYWDSREELTTYNDVVYKGEIICIPKSIRPEMLRIIHQPHLGMVKSKQRARDLIYWPGMNKQIEDMIAKCSTCLEHRNNLPREPMIPHPIPDLPWNKVGSDLFHLNGNNYLLTVDYYSGFIEVDKLSDTSTTTVVHHLKGHIARYGIMETLITDNGPQYSSLEFRNFTKAYHIQHKTSSPLHQQGNGLAEKSVQTVKRLIKKVTEDGGDLHLALLDLQNTPRDDIIGSPTQRLMGRRTRTLLPTTTALLKPQTKPPQIVQQKLESYRDKQKYYFDRGTKEHPKINPSDAICIKTPKGWKPAEFVDHHDTPRSSYVKAGPRANQYRRNRRFLMNTSETPHHIKPQPWIFQPAPHPGRSNTGKEEIAMPQRNPEPETTKHTRSGRAVNPPVWLKNYEH